MTGPSLTSPGVTSHGALQGVLFDMDGLLVDSEPLWFEVESAIMARLGSSWSAADQEALIGSTLEKSSSYMAVRAARPVPATVIGEWLVRDMAALVRSRGVQLLPGAADLLAEITAAGVPRALVTSAEREIMQAALTAAGVSFPVTVCAQDVRRGKPQPEPYLRAAALLGADPARCVALEDSPSGISSALAAGCAVIAVPSVPLPPGMAQLAVPSLAAVNLATLRERINPAAGVGAGRPEPGRLPG